MNQSPDILWIKSRMPGLIQDGSNVVTQGLLRSVPEAVPIDLLCLELTGREADFAASNRGRFRRCEVAVPDNSGSVLWRAACRIAYEVLSHATTTPRSVFYETGRRARQSLEGLLRATPYRRIVAEYYTISRLLEPIASRTTLILQDADHVTLAMQAAEASPAAAAALRYRAWQMRRCFARDLGGIDRLVTLSRHDRMAFESLGLRNVRSVSVPMPPPPASGPDLSGSRIVFLGSVDYLPNLQGLGWFVDRVLPRIVAEMPETRLMVIGGGREAVSRRFTTNDHVDWVGWVPMDRVASLFADAALAVAPMWFGTGVKTKVLDLIWQGLPVVATTIAGRGTPAEHGGALVADTPEDFAAAVLGLLRSRERRIETRRSAWEILLAHHASPEALDTTYRTLLGE